ERCMQRAIEYGEPWDEELQIQTSQGQRKWVRSVGRPVYRHNEVVALQGVFQDINEQVAGRLTKKEISKDYLQELEKEIETKNKELEQSHAKYLALYENSPEMQVSVDPNTGLILSCNKTLVKKLGYSSKEYVIGKPILSVYSQESVEDAKACLAQFKKHGFVKSQELKVLGNLEEPLDVLLNVNAIKDQNGNIVSSQSVWTDITERNAMLKRLKNKRLLLDVMTELNTDGWWDWDLTQPENEYMSPGFKKLFGYEDHEVPNQSSWWQEHIFPEDKQLAIQAFEDHVEHGKPYHVNVRYRHKNGSTIWVLCRGYAIRDEKGTPIRMLGTHTDITTLKNLQIELEKSNRELSQFAYVASHDLRAPLRHIASYSEFIKEKFWKNDDQESLQWFKYIDSGITHMRALIDSLLSFSRVGREGLNKTNVDMVKACEKLDRILNAPLNECGGEIEWENLCQVQADEMIITRVLQNLIENSIKFRCPDRPLKIHIRCEEADRQWKFFIRDNGIGIQKEFHEKIFDLFQKLHSKDQYEGVGMGLAICKKSIELHGGEIHIEEPQDKIGILIHFTLPK
ncbi:MAG: PAS domain-containing protein, partial [Bdellovibrionales bacterium]|nr:PAS domain-containing protein [Bdellovibrionales bacterium]